MARWKPRNATESFDTVTWTTYNKPNLDCYSNGESSLVSDGAAEYLHNREQSKRFSHPEGKVGGRHNRILHASLDLHSSHIQSPTPFNKQIPRPDILDRFPDVNENRFNVLKDFSPVHPKVKKVCSPNLSKSLPRKKKTKSDVQEAVEYSPKFDLIWKRQIVDFSFEKTPSRKKFVDPGLDLAYQNVSYQQVRGKIPSPDFKRTSHKSDGSDFPIFMQNIVSWQGLHYLSDKMLEMNSAYHPSPPAADAVLKVAYRHHRTTSQ